MAYIKMISSDILPGFCQLTLVLTFSYAAFKKQQSIEEFIATIEVSFNTSSDIARLLSYFLVLLEVFMAFAMILAHHLLTTWIVMIALLVIFFSLSIFSVVSEKSIQCNCFGETSQMGWPHVFRNLILLLAAVYCFIVTPLVLPSLQTLMALIMSMILLGLLVSVKDLTEFLRWQ